MRESLGLHLDPVQQHRDELLVGAVCEEPLGEHEVDAGALGLGRRVEQSDVPGSAAQVLDVPARPRLNRGGAERDWLGAALGVAAALVPLVVGAQPTLNDHQRTSGVRMSMMS